jgi:hypothetical protein
MVRDAKSTETLAVTGRIPSLMPRRNCRTKPRTKVGTEISRSENTRIVESNQPPRRTPAMVPSVIPKMDSMARA